MAYDKNFFENPLEDNFWKLVRILREKKAREAQENNEEVDPQWGLEDWLHSVRTRMAMIQRRGDTLCELVEKACEAL